MIAPHHFPQLRGKPLLEREEEEAREEAVSIRYSHVLGKKRGIAVKKKRGVFCPEIWLVQNRRQCTLVIVPGCQERIRMGG